MEDNAKKIFSEWLEKLQQESWQLELLISGFALVGIYEMKGPIQDLTYFLDQNTYGYAESLLGFLSQALSSGWYIFFINLLVHVILRGLWIGAIGLRYVSGNIEYENLKYSAFFTAFLQKKVGDFDDFIEKLERFCSVLFAYTFLLFFLFLSFMIFQGVAIAIMLTSFRMGELGITGLSVFFYILFFLYSVLGLLVFTDFIGLGWLKKIQDRGVSRTYSYLYRFYSTVTLSFLYRPLLYNFLDHKFTRKLFLLSIPYILIILLSDGWTFNNFTFFPEKKEAQKTGILIDDYSYGDLLERKLQNLDTKAQKTLKASMGKIFLNKFYMDDPYPSLFFALDPADQDLLKKRKGLKPFFKEGFRLGLFSDKEYKDPDLHAFNESLEEKRLNLVHQARDWKDSLKNVLDQERKSYYEGQYALYRDSAKNLRILSTSQKDQWQENKLQTVLDSIKSLVDIHIDGISYHDSLFCQYYIHPNLEEKGILCHFSSAGIAKGPHQLEVERKYLKILPIFPDSLVSRRYVLPFIKVN